jgi:hypothetical protein
MAADRRDRGGRHPGIRDDGQRRFSIGRSERQPDLVRRIQFTGERLRQCEQPCTLCRVERPVVRGQHDWPCTGKVGQHCIDAVDAGARHQPDE